MNINKQMSKKELIIVLIVLLLITLFLLKNYIVRCYIDNILPHDIVIEDSIVSGWHSVWGQVDLDNKKLYVINHDPHPDGATVVLFGITYDIEKRDLTQSDIDELMNHINNPGFDKPQVDSSANNTENSLSLEKYTQQANLFIENAPKYYLKYNGNSFPVYQLNGTVFENWTK